MTMCVFGHDFESDDCLVCGGFLGSTCTNCGDVYLREYEEPNCTCDIPHSRVMAERAERLEVERLMNVEKVGDD